MQKEKRKVEDFDENVDGESSWGMILQWLVVLLIIGIIVIVILVILGPIIGNTFSDVISGLR